MSQTVIFSQSKWHSAIEAAINVAVGIFIAFAAQLWIFSLYDIILPISTNIIITLFFTAVSLIRSYLIRRIFNLWHVHLVRQAIANRILTDVAEHLARQQPPQADVEHRSVH